MKAVWYETPGAAHQVLQVGELPDPQPAPGEVRVRIACSGVNPSDVKRRAGWRGQAPGFARTVPNNDGAGTIDAVGAGVDPARIGERVWLHSTGWKRPGGTAAGFAVTPAHRAVRLPRGVSLREGAALGVPAMTAHRAVHGCGPVAGRTVLVTGGAGAVGFYAVQLAVRAGARVIATAQGDEKLRRAREAGAHHVIDYRREDVAARVHEIAGTVDHVVDVDFAANLATSAAVLAPGGSIATYASMSDPEPRLPFYPLMQKNLRLLWVFVYEMPQQAQLAAADEITAWLADGRSVHQLGPRFDLAQTADAHVAVESGVLGKVTITIGADADDRG